MKTFVPFSGSTPEEGILRSLLCLDDKRLGKQRVETYQIWKMVRGLPFDNTKRPANHASLQPMAWSRHPAVAQWMGYADALALYLLVSLRLWGGRLSPNTGRPYSNEGMQGNVDRWRIEFTEKEPGVRVTFANTAFPPWWGDVRIHDSDKAILYRKDKNYYAAFRPYALVYEQYCWPYQIQEEAARRERLALGITGEEEDDEEEDGGEDDGEGGGGKAKKQRKKAPASEKKAEKTAKPGKAKAKAKGKAKAAAKAGEEEAKKPKRKRRGKAIEVIELDGDSDEAGAVEEPVQPSPSTNGRKPRRRKLKLEDKTEAETKVEEKSKALRATEERAEEEVEDNVVAAPAKNARRGKKAAVELLQVDEVKTELVRTPSSRRAPAMRIISSHLEKVVNHLKEELNLVENDASAPSKRKGGRKRQRVEQPVEEEEEEKAEAGAEAVELPTHRRGRSQRKSINSSA